MDVVVAILSVMSGALIGWAVTSEIRDARDRDRRVKERLARIVR